MFIAKPTGREECAINSQTSGRSDFVQRPTSELSPTARVFSQAVAAMPEALLTTDSRSMSRTGLSATAAVAYPQTTPP
jgi:hypothetical protein